MPAFAEAMFFRGLTFNYSAQPDSGRPDFEAAVIVALRKVTAFDPMHAPAVKKLLQSYYRLEDFDTAARYRLAFTAALASPSKNCRNIQCSSGWFCKRTAAS